ncbi:hypothetical protein [Haliea sp. E17]|uniref:hypothetical protein n=1 Tax=Haliea sp. E17 TaxID=3401576 RepID=UPI003AAF13FC
MLRDTTRINCTGKIATVFLLAMLAGCVSNTIKTTSVPSVDTPSVAVAENQLLDVGIAIFDPGIDDAGDEEETIYPEVRRAESRFMPNQLAQAMQQSGAWGAVRVVPDPERVSDLSVHGKIVHSDGEYLELAITARDSRGHTWLEKSYSGHASAYAYKAGTVNTNDPFQAIYNTIANDLLRAQEKLPLADRDKVRMTTELRFASHFAPDAFGGYLAEDKDGEYQLLRLPAAGDPMLERIEQIRDRDHAYVDTMQEYYNQFGDQMYPPYQEWRKQSFQEAIAMQELKAESQRNLILGAVAVAAGIAGVAGGDSSTTRAMGNIAVIGGGYMIKSGLDKRNEAQIHVEALEELGTSLEAEITPQVIELEDRSITLSGSVEDQYAQWRSLLTEIYATEVGALEMPESVADSSTSKAEVEH